MIKNQSVLAFDKPSYLTDTFYVLVGSIFLAIISQASFLLPFSPVPVTLQTMGIFLLVIAQGKNKALLSVVAYLCQAQYGYPVLAGGSVNFLWMIGPRGGYLIGFAIAAYVIGFLLDLKKTPNFVWVLLSLLVGDLIICSLGTLWLSGFVGFKNSLQLGFIPFIPGEVCKIVIAASLVKPINWLINKISSLNSL